MEIIIDIIIAIAAFVAAAYCLVLSRRLRALARLDGDLGRAIAILSQQVDGLSSALARAQTSTKASEQALAEKIAEAETTARRLELLMAAYRPPPPETTSGLTSPRETDESTPSIRQGSRAPERTRRVLRHRESHGVAP